MPLTLLSSLNVDNPGGGVRQLQLLQGDVANLSPQDAVDVLAISALPGDYTPTPRSVIGALAAHGVSVAALAANKAANYAPAMPCWVSQPVTGGDPGIQFGRLLVFEPAQPALNAAALVWTVFQSLLCFRGTAATTLALPILSTGSGGADPQAILRAIFWAAVHYGSSNAFPLNTVKVVAYDNNMAAQLKPLFDSLAASYTGVFSLPLPGGYASFVTQAQNSVNSRGVPAGLSRRQAVAMCIYTTNYYGSINSVLRTSAPTDPAYLQMMPLFEAIDSGLWNVGPFGGTCYRGDNMTPQRRAQHAVGAVIQNLAYTSTSTTQLGFGADRLVIASQTGRPVSNVSVYPNEAEVLFERLMQYRVDTRSCPGGDNNPCTFGVTQLVTPWCGGAAADAAPRAATGVTADAGMAADAAADATIDPQGGIPMPELTREGAERVLAAYDRTVATGGQARAAAFSSDALPGVQALASAISLNGVEVTGFDWQAWTPAADHSIEDPAFLARADVQTLRRALTAHLRLDRFVEGHLHAMLERGVIGAAMERLRALVAQGAIQ